jgi:hypothetical protein
MMMILQVEQIPDTHTTVVEYTCKSYVSDTSAISSLVRPWPPASHMGLAGFNTVKCYHQPTVSIGIHQQGYRP